MTERNTEWSPDEDIILAEGIIAGARKGWSIRKVSPALIKKLREVGSERTESACAFRWHNVVKKQYTQAYSMAKQQYKDSKKEVEKQQEQEDSKPIQQAGSLTVADVVKFLEELEAFKKEAMELREEVNRLQGIEEKYNTLKTDYNAVLEVIAKARKVIVEEQTPQHKFKMDRNGNLERLA